MTIDRDAPVSRSMSAMLAAIPGVLTLHEAERASRAALDAILPEVRKAALAEFADDYQRKYENIEPSDSEGRGYWRGARNAVEHVLAAIRAAALGDAPTGGQ